jgi:hypothetical protein
VTLIMACVVFGAWMRCRFYIDGVRFTCGDQQHLVCGIDDCIRWSRWPLRMDPTSGWIMIGSAFRPQQRNGSSPSSMTCWPGLVPETGESLIAH